MNAVRAELSDLLSKNSDTHGRLDESLQQIQLLKDQNALLKAQKGACCFSCIAVFTYFFIYLCFCQCIGLLPLVLAIVLIFVFLEVFTR